MNTSPMGIALLKKLEGFRSTPYKCSAGHPTIGYGHKIGSNEDFPTITIEKATELLKRDVAAPERLINGRLPRLHQNQFDALVCFIFNIGVGAFERSSVFKHIKSRDYKSALLFWEMYCKERCPKTKLMVTSKGLLSRRKAETSLFKSADSIF